MPSNMLNPLISGAFAGLMVDTILYPLDTLKTRLQAVEGFQKSGGFRGVYRGLSSAMIGAAPGAGLFFFGYEGCKNWYAENYSYSNNGQHVQNLDLFGNILASCVAEITACVARCPTENVKQNSQVNLNKSTWQVFQSLYNQRGLAGFYRGYFTLVAREIPFAMIQMPLWEFLKSYYGLHSALAGAIAGSIAAFLTTPLDVAKTRQMLDKSDNAREKVFVTLQKIYKLEGHKGLFRGGVPRVLWIAFGGAIFLGSYDYAKDKLQF